MRYVILIIILILSLSFTISINDNEYDLSKRILQSSTDIDSSYSILDFKQGAFSIFKSNDTLFLMFNKFVIGNLKSTINKYDTIPDNVDSDFRLEGHWNFNAVFPYSIVSINKDDIIELEVKEKYGDIAPTFNFNWNNLNKRGIKGFIVFSKVYYYNKNKGVIAMGIYSKNKYQFVIYSIPQKLDSNPEKLIKLSFNLIGFEAIFDKDKVINIRPNIITIEEMK